MILLPQTLDKKTKKGALALFTPHTVTHDIVSMLVGGPVASEKVKSKIGEVNLGYYSNEINKRLSRIGLESHNMKLVVREGNKNKVKSVWCLVEGGTQCP